MAASEDPRVLLIDPTGYAVMPWGAAVRRAEALVMAHSVHRQSPVFKPLYVEGGLLVFMEEDGVQRRLPGNHMAQTLLPVPLLPFGPVIVATENEETASVGPVPLSVIAQFRNAYPEMEENDV